MFNFKKVTNYRIDEMENKIIAIEKTIEAIKAYIITADENQTRFTHEFDKKLDDIGKVIDKQNLRIEELSKAKTTTKAKKGTTNAKPEPTTKA